MSNFNPNRFLMDLKGKKLTPCDLKRRSKKGNTAEERFYTKLSLPTETGCIEWQGILSRLGYGTLKVGERNFSTHRISWVLAYSEIPEGQCVLHRCDNRRCVNPLHLFLGTQSENIQDKIQKGRAIGPRGEKCARCKITEDTARQVKAAISRGLLFEQVSQILPSVSIDIYKDIKRGKTWVHLQ